MNNQVLFTNEEIYFGDNIPPEVKHVLLEATRVYPDLEKTESFLEQAYQMAPTQLEVYYARYKFYFYNKHLVQAEQVAREGLQQAARQAGFNPDWNELDETMANWVTPNDTERFYLYTLKALAFISMRQEQFREAENILNKLQQLDKTDQVGSSVVMDILQGLKEANEEAA
jgi:tetratricopeptide (TPR) repeat protein